MKYSILFISIFISFSCIAQVKYGFIGGINAGAPIPSNLPKGAKGNPGINPILGFTTLKQTDSKFFYKASIFFEKKTASYESPVDYNNIVIAGDTLDGFVGIAKGNFKNQYISLPFTAFYKLYKEFSIGAGPYISYLLKGSNKGIVNGIAGRFISVPVNDQAFDESNNINKIDIGANITFNYKLNDKIDFQWQTSYGISSVTKPTDNFKDKIHNIYTNLTASYFF